MKHTSNNLVGYWEALSSSERRFLCGIVNRFTDRPTLIHEGTLPFVSLELVTECLGNMTEVAGVRELRKVYAILPKIGAKVDNSVEFTMSLDDKKVRRFSRGTSDESLIITLEARDLVESGIRWQEFGKKYVKPKTNVKYHAELIRINHNLWKVRVNKKVLDATKSELFSRFGYHKQ